MNYELHTYINGLRLVTAHYPGSAVEYFGVAVNVGSAHETERRHGLAHFVEHCIFKGTQHHSSNYIINRIESIGGELNAYTNKEETVVYSVAPAGNLRRCASLIAEIVTSSVFPDEEIDKERGVISEEIDSYLDAPAEAIFDEVDERLFKGTSLAHNILGTKESIANFSSVDCQEWLNRYFIPANSVIFYSGPLSHLRVRRLVERAFGKYVRPGISIPGAVVDIKGQLFNEKINLGLCHQCHVATAFRIPGIDDLRQPELLLLANILGGPGMNSWLNLSMREKRGLVYTVEASTSFYQNAGSFVIYYGCDHEDLNTCRRLVTSSLKKISEKQLTERQLQAAKNQYMGQLTISLENRENSIMAAARSLLCRGYILKAEELQSKMAAVTPGSLLEAAALIHPSLVSELLIN